MFKCLKWLFDFNFVQDKYITVIHSNTMFENQIYDLFKLPHGIFRIKILNNYILIERV